MSSLLTGITRRSMAFASQVAQQTSEGAMNSLILIVRKGGYDQQTREWDSEAETVIYDHPDLPGSGWEAGVTLAQGPITMSLGDEQQYYSSITAYIPHGRALRQPRIDDVITIMSNPEPELNGRLFRVTDVPVGGRIHSSVQIQAIGIAPSKQWAV